MTSLSFGSSHEEGLVMTEQQDLTEMQFEVLRAAVNLARNRQVRTKDDLRNRLLSLGYDEPDVDQAIAFWSESIKSRHPTQHDLARAVSLQDW